MIENIPHKKLVKFPIKKSRTKRLGAFTISNTLQTSRRLPDILIVTYSTQITMRIYLHSGPTPKKLEAGIYFHSDELSTKNH